MLVPAEAGPSAERRLDLRLCLQACRRQLERAADEGRTVFVGQREGVLRRQLVALGRRVVRDEVAGRLGVQPLADVALRGASLLGELGRGDGARLRHRLVQAEPIAEHDQAGVHGRSKLSDQLPEKCVELVLVDD